MSEVKTQAAGSKPAPPPQPNQGPQQPKPEPPVQGPPEPKPEPVAFESPSRRKRVYDEQGKTVARFDEGRLTTSDPQVVAVLDGLPDVRRVDA
jgi:hypothetical protein